jgi:FKBP-type peptidyl-prolyl cis-trans isomerase
MRYFLPVSLLFSLLVFACSSDDKTPNGYKYINYTHLEGEKGNVGDYAYVHVYIYEDDSLVNTSRNQGRTVPITIPDLNALEESEKGPGRANPIADVVGMMAVGDSVSVFVPVMPEMIAKAPNLKDVKVLRYDVVLAEIKNQEEYQAALEEERRIMNERIEASKAREAEVAELLSGIVEDYKNGKLDDKIKMASPTSLKYLILEEGSGKKAEKGKRVDVQYYGVLTDGSEFDNSFKRGRPYGFTLGKGEVIQGWDIGIELLKEGDKAVLFIPAELGYGDHGSGRIPGGAEMIFYVELEKVY